MEAKRTFSARHLFRHIGPLVVGGAILGALLIGFPHAIAQAPTGQQAERARAPRLSLPDSSFLEPGTVKNDWMQPETRKIIAEGNAGCPSMAKASKADMPSIRNCQAEAFYKLPVYAKMRDRFKVAFKQQVIGGVPTETITPSEGVAKDNQNRVLINVHGGGFTSGVHFNIRMESMPIAAIGKFKVVGVDYRLAPEATFPAASEDVAAVYRELLKTYKPKNIGIYGCSAGGVLAAESIAWLQHEKLPMPGAVGMFCGAGYYWTDGDSGNIDAARSGARDAGSSEGNPYFKGVDPKDPLAFPGRSPEALAKFPPSLLISATRDFALSGVVQTHSQLVAQGVEAELHVWEGLGHAFFFNPEFRQSREVYDVVVKFFAKHLGR